MAAVRTSARARETRSVVERRIDIVLDLLCRGGMRAYSTTPAVGPILRGVIVSRAVTDNLARASWIRRMLEEGARLKQERGAEKVFDFAPRNPALEPPPA